MAGSNLYFTCTMISRLLPAFTVVCCSVACAVNIVRVDETTKHHDPLDLLCGASICTTEVIVGGKVGFVRTEDCTIVSIPAVAAKSLDAMYALI